jgi:general stress protein CsbA
MGLFNKVKNVIPELYLILAVLYYWSLTASLLNPIAISLLLVLVYQIITRKQILGIVIATVLILASVYLILALLSELSEFIEFNDDAKELAIFGVLYLGLNITFGAIMLYRYAIKNEIKQTEIIHNN